MRAVNLLPSGSESRKSFRKEDPAVVIGSALGAVVLVSLGIGFMSVHSKVNAEQQKLTTARTELAKLSLTKKPPIVSKPVVTKPIVPIPAVTSEEQPRLTAITSALSTRIAWDRILREFSLVLPSDVKIAALTLTAPAAPTAAAPGALAPAASQGLSISGSAFSHDGVARLLSRLMLIPDLSDVTLSSSTAGTGAAAGVQFSISASVKGAPAPPALPAPVVAVTTDTTAGASS
jgi:Tfp pilus assembly protein PilN